MTNEWNSNYDPDPFDDEYALGAANAVPVKIVEEEKENEGIVDKILSHDDYPNPSVIVSPATQTNYVQNRVGWVFDVSLLVVATFTVGSVAVYKNFIADEALIYNFTSTGIFQFSKGQLALRYNDQLIFVANNVTGNVTPSMHGNIVRRALWPEYLM
jgi:hypothetical protein